jgi:hypothetical protein
MLKPSILDIDDTPSHIATLLAAQTNDQERYTLAEKTVMKLINRHNEQTDLLEDNEKLLNERKDLLENNDKLLHQQEDLLHEGE